MIDTDFVRVLDTQTGHRYSVKAYNPAVHHLLDEPAVDADGKPLPAEPAADPGPVDEMPDAERDQGDAVDPVEDAPDGALDGEPTVDPPADDLPEGHIAGAATTTEPIKQPDATGTDPTSGDPQQPVDATEPSAEPARTTKTRRRSPQGGTDTTGGN